MRVNLHALMPTRIDLYEEYKNEAGGRAYRSKDFMILQPGSQEAPDDFMREYFASEHNQGSRLVTSEEENKDGGRKN